MKRKTGELMAVERLKIVDHSSMTEAKAEDFGESTVRRHQQRM